MKHFEAGWKSADGLDIYLQGWQPETEAKAVIGLVHGLGEHSGRYSAMADYYTHAGCAILSYDLHGHGKSGGKRGVIPSLDGILDDVQHFLEEVRQRFSGKPVFLYGHSLGGNIVLTYTLQRHPALNGVIATGPCFRAAFEPPAWKLGMANLLANITPGLVMGNGLERAALSRDVRVVQSYENDPLVHDRISTRLAVELFRMGNYCLEHAAEFPLPLLLMHGSADRLTSVPASREFASHAGSVCTLKIWEGFYHEIHNEPEQDQVFDYALSWLDGHLN